MKVRGRGDAVVEQSKTDNVHSYIGWQMCGPEEPAYL